MPQDISKHSFEGGMNKDLSKSKIQPNQYTDAKNITVSLNEENNLISLTNIKGNTKQWGLPYLDTASGPDRLFVYDRSNDDTLQTILFADIEITKAEVDANGLDYRIVGYTTIRNTLVLLTRPKTNVNGLSIIWTVNLDSPSTNPVLKYVGLLNFPLSPIDVEGNYESSTIQKIYWADGTNELGHFNIADSEGYKLNADKLSTSSLVTLNNISLTSVAGSGNFNAGVVQYTYQYYDKNGIESSVGPLTNPIPIAESLKKGNLKTDENIGKNFTLNLTVDTRWEYIKVYRVAYSANAITPTQIDVIIDQKNISDLTFTDDGNVSLRTATTSELLNIIYSSTIPSNIKIKDQRLLLGNYTESIYNPTYDARAFRFDSSTTTTIIEDSDGNTYTVDSTDDYNITQVNGSPVTPYAIPETHDCINPDNSLSVFSGAMYQPNGITLGAKGINVTISFTTEAIELDGDITDYSRLSRSNTSTALGSAYVSDRRSWKRDEIYRVGVVLINTKGQESLPKWTCDLRMPSCNTKLISSVSGNVVSAEYLYPTFTFDNLPNDCVAVKVVRVKRETKDKTIISQGYILPITEPQTVGTSFHPLASTTNYLFKTGILTYNTTNSYSSGDVIYIPDENIVLIADDGAGAIPSNVSAANLISTYSVSITSSNYDNKPITSIYNNADYFETTNGESLVYFIHPASDVYNVTLVPKDKIVFYSPELEFEKTIDDADDNYLNIAQILSTNGEYYIGTSTTPSAGIINFQTGATNLYNFEKALTSYAMSGTYDGTLSITNSIILDTDDAGILSSADYYNTPFAEDKFNYRNNIGLFIKFNSAITLPNNQDGIYLFDYKRPLLNQYNGQTYAARNTNSYISASIIQVVSSNSATITAKQGDTFITEWNHFPTYRRGDSDVVRINSTILLIESDYDLTKRLTTDVANYNSGNGITGIRDFVKDTYEPSTTFSEYINNVYNTQNILHTYNVIDDDLLTITYPSTFKISEVKFNNETTDSWLQFLANNYLDVDGKYGPINSINEVNDTIIFFQDDAAGQLSINPKYASATSEGSLIVGTGGILDDYKYITTTHGCKNRESILRTPKGLYYFDIQNKKLRMLGDEQSPLSDIKGLHSYLKDNVSNVSNNPIQANGITVGYDYSTNKAYFTFHTNNPFTISYDESLNIIESFIDCNPLLWITTRQGIFSTMSEADYNTNLKADDFYQFGTGQYGRFFGTLYPSYITFIENKNPDVVKILNNIEYFNEVTNSGVEDTTNTFDYLQVWNNYQDTTELPLTYPNRIHIYDRKWRLPIPRNYKPYNPTILESTGNTLSSGVYVLHPTTFYLYKTLQTITNYNLPSNNSLDQDKFLRVKTRLDRIRDFASFIKLKFTNDGVDKLIAHDILVKYDY